VRVLPRDAEIEPVPLQLRRDFHRESTIRYDYAGGRVRVAFVSALDVAHALASDLDLTTGLLPPDTRWLAKTGTGPVFLLLPDGQAPYVCAAAERPARGWSARGRAVAIPITLDHLLFDAGCGTNAAYSQPRGERRSGEKSGPRRKSAEVSR
jgi:hypothetical protein